MRLLLKSVQEVKDQCGFAHARLRNQGQEPTAGFDAARQGIERLALGSAGVDEARVRCHAERLLFHSVELQKHRAAPFDSLTPRPPSERHGLRVQFTYTLARAHSNREELNLALARGHLQISQSVRAFLRACQIIVLRSQAVNR